MLPPHPWAALLSFQRFVWCDMRAGWRRTFAIENSEVNGGSKVSDTAKAKTAKSTSFIYTPHLRENKEFTLLFFNYHSNG